MHIDSSWTKFLAFQIICNKLLINKPYISDQRDLKLASATIIIDITYAPIYYIINDMISVGAHAIHRKPRHIPSASHRQRRSSRTARRDPQNDRKCQASVRSSWLLKWMKENRKEKRFVVTFITHDFGLSSVKEWCQFTFKVINVPISAYSLWKQISLSGRGNIYLI